MNLYVRFKPRQKTQLTRFLNTKPGSDIVTASKVLKDFNKAALEPVEHINHIPWFTAKDIPNLVKRRIEATHTYGGDGYFAIFWVTERHPTPFFEWL